MKHHPGPTPGPLPGVPRGRAKHIFLERMFPIKAEQHGAKLRMSGEVPWAVAELAWANYARLPELILEDVAERGGWTWSELLNLLSHLPERSGALPISSFVGSGSRHDRRGRLR